jgi:hypothetical protein
MSGQSFKTLVPTDDQPVRSVYIDTKDKNGPSAARALRSARASSSR